MSTFARALLDRRIQPSIEWHVNPFARALADEAVAVLEVQERFGPPAQSVRMLAAQIEALEPSAPINAVEVEEVLRLGSELARFAEVEFDFKPFDWLREDPAQPFLPQGETFAYFQLAIERLLRSARSPEAEGETVIEALADYRRVWAAPVHIPGLANWAPLLANLDTTLRNNQGINPEVDATLSDLRTAQVTKIANFMYGEGLLMESYQSQTLNEIACQFLTDDVEPAWQRVLRAADGTSRTQARRTISADEAANQLFHLVRRFDEVELIGKSWIEQSAGQVKKLGLDRTAQKTTDFTEHLVLRDRDPRRKHVVVVSPHHDDEVRIHDLIARLASTGYEVSMVVMTDSSAGDPQEPGVDKPGTRHGFADQRRQETLAAAKRLDIAEVYALNFGDSGMAEDPSPHRFRLADANPTHARDKLVGILRALEADLVLTPESQPPYLHPDHVITAQLTKQAVERLNSVFGHNISMYYAALDPNALIANYKKLGLDKFEGLEQMRSVKNQPDTRIEVGFAETSEARAARLCHVSQVSANGSWVDGEHGGYSYLRQAFPAPEPTEPGEYHTELVVGSFNRPAANKTLSTPDLTL